MVNTKNKYDLQEFKKWLEAESSRQREWPDWNLFNDEMFRIFRFDHLVCDNPLYFYNAHPSQWKEWEKLKPCYEIIQKWKKEVDNQWRDELNNRLKNETRLLEEFKIWLENDKSRRREVNWEKLFFDFEEKINSRFYPLKESAIFELDKEKKVDKVDTPNLFYSYLEEVSWQAKNIFIGWICERVEIDWNQINMVNAQEWLNKQFVGDSQKEKAKIKNIVISSSISREKERIKHYKENLYLATGKDCLEGKLDLNEFVNLENLYIGRQKISELDTENCRKLFVVDIDKINSDEEIKWNRNLCSRVQQADKLEKEKAELEGILEKFAKRKEDLEQENQELSKQLAEMKLKLEEKMETKIEIDLNK